MMRVWQMRVIVGQRHVSMRMAVLRARRVARPVLMLVVCIVPVQVLVRKRVVLMGMEMPFAKKHAQTGKHQTCRNSIAQMNWFAENRN